MNSLTIPKFPLPIQKLSSFLSKNPLRRQKQQGRYSELLARISAAQSLQERSSLLAQNALKSVLSAYPENKQSERQESACLRDISLFIKFIVDALVSADISAIDDRLLNGLHETYYALGLSPLCAVTALESIKKDHQFSQLKAQLTNKYIDYIIDKLRKD